MMRTMRIRAVVIAGTLALGGLGAAVAVTTAGGGSKPPTVHVDQVANVETTTTAPPVAAVPSPAPAVAPVPAPAPIVSPKPQRVETQMAPDPNPEHTIDTDVTPAGDDVPPNETPPPPPFTPDGVGEDN